jgi:hypothetical protein
MSIIKTNNGITYWDVTYNGILIQRFDTKWQAQEFINDHKHMITA